MNYTYVRTYIHTQAHMCVREGVAALGLRVEAAHGRIVEMLLDAARAAT